MDFPPHPRLTYDVPWGKGRKLGPGLGGVPHIAYDETQKKGGSRDRELVLVVFWVCGVGPTAACGVRLTAAKGAAAPHLLVVVAAGEAAGGRTSSGGYLYILV